MGGAQSVEKPREFDMTKTSYYMVPESPWDHLEVSSEAPSFSPVRVSTDDLYSAVRDPIDSVSRKEVGKKLLKGIKDQQFVIVQLSEDEMQEESHYFDCIKEFLNRSKAEKAKYLAKPQELKSGYSEIVFDNRDNLRDPEIRDVFQIRMGEEGHIPWFSDEFKQRSYAHFERQWNISLSIIELVVGELGISFEEFKELITKETKYLSEEFLNSGEMKEFHGSPETNLSMFRYTDTQNYKQTQKCMVHRDNGFVTLLPKSTAPGIQVLQDNLWIPMEEHTQPGEMLAYLGIAAELFSGRNLPALRHRVVRQPGGIRFSLPFEMKPRRDAKIAADVTGDSLEKQAYWERIQSTVSRSDSAAMTGS